ncbi:calcium/sodium antiporter [Patescibacteria group bacterium]|nr:calcium/sodium antiporter [Patescibacteria group bacterium]
MLVYLLFFVGFVILIKGADLLVDGSSAIAKRLKISDLIIGLTIVSFGTSAPELIVNIFAGLSGHNDLAIGNIFGSNIANVFLILGISALIFPLDIDRNTSWRQIPFALLATLLVGFLANDYILFHHNLSQISRIDGLILLISFFIFISYTFGIAKIRGKNKPLIKKLDPPKAIIYIILGLIALGLGGRWIVSGATHIAQHFGMSQSLIGLTIIAIGTSLPELATSAFAAYKKNSEIAVGNIVGSNIFNLLWILGLGSILSPIVYNPASNIDLYMVILSSFVLFCFIFIGKKNILERWQGGLFILIYATYLIFLIFKG